MTSMNKQGTQQVARPVCSGRFAASSPGSPALSPGLDRPSTREPGCGPGRPRWNDNAGAFHAVHVAHLFRGEAFAHRSAGVSPALLTFAVSFLAPGFNPASSTLLGKEALCFLW